jgi:D-alanyl-lipoteichoic acid acyltransferase DltB (MBOAT superfamily)
MDFYSPEFFAFSLAVLALFFVVPARLRWGVLLAASYSFYAAFKAAYLGILVFCTLAAYGGALAMNRCEARQTRRLMLIAGLVCQLDILGIFKYVSFLDASLGQLLGWGGMAYSGIALTFIVPVGISFYVFKTSATWWTFTGGMCRPKGIRAFLPPTSPSFRSCFPGRSSGPRSFCPSSANTAALTRSALPTVSNWFAGGFSKNWSSPRGLPLSSMWFTPTRRLTRV